MIGRVALFINNAFGSIASHPTLAHEICSTDGTVSGTRVETDLRAGMASSNILGFASHGEHLFFLASGQIDGIETGSSLWHLQKNGRQP